MRLRAVLAWVVACGVTGAAGPAGPAGGTEPRQELLYASEGNNLRRFDIETLNTPWQREQTLIRRASDSEDPGGPLDPESRFRDVNGMICALPDGSGRFVAGEDTGQPSPPAGWGVFESGGTQVGKLTATYQNASPEPYGCAFDAEGRLFTSDIGAQGADGGNGQLLVWFPPFDRFPGPPGAYPNTDAVSDHFCVLATDIGNASGVAVDDQGRVYVASPSGLVIRRWLPPFPEAVADCTGTDPQGSPRADVEEEIFVGADVIRGMLSFSGLAMSGRGTLYAASVATGRIAEYDLDGNLLRLILAPPLTVLPPPTGTPQGIAVDSEGTLYYADLDLVGRFPNLSPGPNGKIRRIRFDEEGDPLPPEIVRQDLAFPDGVGVLPGDLERRQWPTFGRNLRRTFFNRDESILTVDNVDELVVKWRFPTGAIITGSPSVATVALPGEGPTSVVYSLSWDGFVYALRLADGSEVWRFETDEQPGATFPYVGSVDVSELGSREVAFIAAGEVMYALDAVTGEEIWRFTAGTGCVDDTGQPPGLCAFDGERNEIESSATVVEDLVLFGMDVNDSTFGKGGFYAVDAWDGRLRWFFDLESGQTCRPHETDEIRNYDPYHSAAELGLPADFFATRPGCDHPRNRNGCGNVWSTPAYDAERGVLYVTSSNCDTDDDPATRKPPPPMPPYDEAIFALDLEGEPVWRWRPREVDNDDLAFGAPPNLFEIAVDGVDDELEVLGVGNKDGTYYVLPRDGWNEQNDVRWDDPDPSGLPYWSTKVVPGGPAGGIVAAASVDEESRRIHLSTAPGFDALQPQQPTFHTLDMDTGAVVWQNGPELRDSSFAPTTAIRGVAFQGSVLSPILHAWQTLGDYGRELLSIRVNGIPFGSAIASGATAVNGVVVVGAGIGARDDNPANLGDRTSRFPTDIVALCVPDTPGCDGFPSGCGLGFELVVLLPVLRRLGRARRGRRALPGPA